MQEISILDVIRHPAYTHIVTQLKAAEARLEELVVVIQKQEAVIRANGQCPCEQCCEARGAND